jgi:hypothetical protein
MAKRAVAPPEVEEVADLQSEPTPPKKMDLEGGLALVTFLALAVGFFLSQKLLAIYDAGLFKK